MYDKRGGVEIKGNIEIVLLILIVVLAAVSALSYYAQKEPQNANQKMPLIKPPPSVNKTTAPLKTVKPLTQRQEAKITLQEKMNPAEEPVVPAAQKTDTGGLPSEQKTAEPLQKNTTTIAESKKTINRNLYSIRVGSFRSKENVDRIGERLKQNGYEPSLETVILSDNSTWYRVTAGQFKTQEEAARCAINLEDKEKIKTKIVEMK